MAMPRRKGFVALLAVVIVALGIGIGIGVAIRGSNTSGSSEPSSSKVKRRNKDSAEWERFKHHRTIVDDLKADNIKNTLKLMTKDPNNAGTKVAKEQAEYVAKTWRDQGFDDVKIHMYDMVLSFPLSPGKIEILDKNGKKLDGIDRVLEKPLVEGENDSRVLYPFNAYSASGTVEGELVYANYGRESDFDALEKIGINVASKIILTRYGKTSRNGKVLRSQVRGAAGVIIFSDPADWAPLGHKFPNGWELPDTGIQRGTLSTRQGDALSQEFPSKEGMYRPPLKSLPKDHFPKIPSQPISAKHAIPLLRLMDGMPAKKTFQGTLNVTYRYNSTRKVRLTVNTTLESRETYSVSAVMYGNEEPDRLVILGNHRDSWTFGAADATSGQAALLEISRALGKMKKDRGWRPRRSIMFCSWDAEEYGIMASTEWVEDHSKMLRERAVAYLNMDIAVEGNYSIRFRSAPELEEAFFDVTKQLKSPSNPNTGLWDEWVKRLPSKGNPKEPTTYTISSGSDYKAFWQQIGVACTDHRYLFDKTTTKKYPYMYPVYHSVHDNFYWLSKFLDPDFRYHLSVAQMWALFALKLADATILPFNLQRGAERIKYYAQKFKKDHQTKYLDVQGIKTDPLVEAAANLTKVATEFHKSLDKINRNDPLQVRMVNDKMILFHRSFIHDTGILPEKGRFITRHTIYSTTYWILESGNKFTGVQEAMYRAVKKWKGTWNDVRRQLTLVIYHMQQATRSLEKLM